MISRDNAGNRVISELRPGTLVLQGVCKLGALTDARCYDPSGVLELGVEASKSSRSKRRVREKSMSSMSGRLLSEFMD